MSSESYTPQDLELQERVNVDIESNLAYLNETMVRVLERLATLEGQSAELESTVYARGLTKRKADCLNQLLIDTVDVRQERHRAQITAKAFRSKMSASLERMEEINLDWERKHTTLAGPSKN